LLTVLAKGLSTVIFSPFTSRIISPSLIPAFAAGESLITAG
jgi:hypothetical protein